MPVRLARASTMAVVLAVAGSLVLAGCGETGAVGSGEVTALNTPPPLPTPSPTASDDALKALVKSHRASFLKVARAFRECDEGVVYDSATTSPCRKAAAAVTAEVNSFVGDLRSIPTPASTSALIANLAEMSAAGAKVAVRCAKRNDQKCDQALARFRADEQSVLWDLDASL